MIDEALSSQLAFLGRNASRGHCLMTGSRLFLTEAKLPFPVEVERKT
ncbi:hypothetical protein HNY42_14475 [Exiguobacterium sp. Helios]|nr:hypothetical protein [Exiguobacterium sp. Helios]QNR22098.1 hypothetical protein HNY42_14475 [Exiguobacterium sp. Helios]